MKETNKYLTILMFCLLGMGCAHAQYYVNMVPGVTYIDGCEHPTGIIYDDGGPTGCYSSHFSGFVVISTPSPSIITLTGSYNTEVNNDYIYVYDGELANGNALTSRLSGNGTISVTSTTGILSIYFGSDITDNHDGLALTYSCTAANPDCTNKPRNLHVTQIADNSIQMHWTAANPYGQFLLDVDGVSTTVTGTIHTLTGLSPGSTYSLMLSSIEDQDEACCALKRRIRTRCNPLSEEDLPYSYGFNDAAGNYYNNTIDNCWTRLSDGAARVNPLWPTSGNCYMELKSLYPDNSAILVMPEYVDSLSKTYVSFYLCNGPDGQSGTVEVGVMSDPLDSTTFVPVGTASNHHSSFEHRYISLEDYTGAGHYVAFRVNGRAEDIYLENVSLDLLPQCPMVDLEEILEAYPTSVVVSWRMASPSIALPTGFEVSATLWGSNTPEVTTTTTNTSIILSGLQPYRRYIITVGALCQDSLLGQTTSAVAKTTDLCAGMSSLSGYGISSIQGVPVTTNRANSACQTIYTASQLQTMGVTAGLIDRISYDWIAVDEDKDFSIFIGTTDQQQYESSNMITSGMREVYSNLLMMGTSGTRIYNFSRPLYWDGICNLVVTTLFSQPANTPQNSSQCYAYSSTFNNNRTLHYGRNSNAITAEELSDLNCQFSIAQPDVTFHSCASSGNCVMPTVMIDSVGFHEVSLAWSSDSTTRSWNVTYKKELDNTWHNVVSNTTATHCRITYLQPGTHYTFRVTAVCDDNQAYAETSITTPCRSYGFLYDDLYADNVICYSGSFDNPQQTQGVMDYGYRHPTSRHTVHHDHRETDPRTGGLLHTVPEGHCSSVRLGNWLTGAQAESITYTYLVDTNDYDLMLLKYASVLQNPDHTADEQPRFTFNITDTAGNNISLCYNADFVANTDLGWNSAPNDVLWKDWTAVGVDLGPLHGQTIHITLTTYDCDQGGHYGYAYYVLDLDNKSIQSTSCSTTENTLYAPAGFGYRWYSSGNPNNTLSTADTLNISHQGNYYCELSYLGAPNDSAHADCHFTLHAVTGERYPFARFTPEGLDSSTCTHTWMRMRNRSITTSDIDRTDSIADGCESYLWEFDDGSTSTEANPRHAFSPGYHTVTLIAMLAGGSCADTAHETFYIASHCLHYDTIYRILCVGDTLTIFGTMITSAGEYHLDSIVNSDSMILRTLFLSSLPKSYDTVTHTVCGSYFWPQSTGTYSETGFYNDTLINAVGCDSIITLDLTIMPAYDLHFYDTIYEGDTVFFEGEAYAHPGEYAYSFATVDSCDSTRTLHLLWRYLVQDTLTDSLCEGLEYHFADTILRTAGLYIDTILTSHYPEPDTLRWLTLVIVPLPEVSLSSSPICDDPPHYTLEALSDMPVFRWSSMPEDPTITYLSNSIITANPELRTRYAVYVDYRERRLCPVGDSIVLGPIDTVWAHIEISPTCLLGDQRKLTAYSRGSGDVDHWEWYVWYDMAAPFLYDTTSNVVLDVPSYVDSLRLALVANNDFCADSDTVAVPILKSELFFPTIFTPNLSTNNVFRAYYADICNFEIWIYDRRGDLVYHSTDINKGWDGTHDGTPCMQNAYVYKCRYTEVTNPGGYRTRTGTVVLVR